MTVKENQANLRALKELEAIKLKKKRKEEEKIAIELENQNLQTMNEKKLKQALL